MDDSRKTGMIIGDSFEKYNVKWNLDENKGANEIILLALLKAAISATYSTSLVTHL